MQKILIKFSREFFTIKDNIIEKNILTYASQKRASQLEDYQNVLPDLLKFYSDAFHSGDKKKALDKLNGRDASFRHQDALSIMFFFGASTVAMIFAIFFLFYDPESGQSEEEERQEAKNIKSILPIFRMCFMLIYFVFASAVAVHIF